MDVLVLVYLIIGMYQFCNSACMMDLHYYPLDRQNCTVEIESCKYFIHFELVLGRITGRIMQKTKLSDM